MSADCPDCRRRARRKATRVMETPDRQAAAARMIRAIGREAHVDIDALPLLAELGDLVATELKTAAQELNSRRDWSWAEIGKRLGITRQSAHERLGRSASGRP